MRTQYVAWDEEIFDSYNECYNYEQMHMMTYNKVLHEVKYYFGDELINVPYPDNIEMTDTEEYINWQEEQIDNIYSKATWIKIDSDNLTPHIQQVNEDFGFILPSTVGSWRWDSDKDEYVRAD